MTEPDAELLHSLETVLGQVRRLSHVAQQLIAPTDMRKGFDSLCGLVTERVGRNPLSGDVFLFVSRDRIRAKVLHFDGTGLCLYVKRLERGRFAALWGDEAAGPLTLTLSELDLFLDGSAVLVSAITVATRPSEAALISIDFRTSGDRLITLDDATGLEWLDRRAIRTKVFSGGIAGRLLK